MPSTAFSAAGHEGAVRLVAAGSLAVLVRLVGVGVVALTVHACAPPPHVEPVTSVAIASASAAPAPPGSAPPRAPPGDPCPVFALSLVLGQGPGTQPLATLDANGAIDLLPPLDLNVARPVIDAQLDARGCVYREGELLGEELPDGELRIDGRVAGRRTGGTLVQGERTARLTPDGRVGFGDGPGLRVVGVVPGAECAALLLFALLESAMPSMASVDGVLPKPLPSPTESRCHAPP